MIELFSSNTPNGKKISILLEEIGCDFKVTAIDLLKDDQFKPDFKKISPFSKIPVIVDHENKKSVFESGAILIYLADKYNKFYDTNHTKHYKPMADGSDGNYRSNAWSASSVPSLQSR